MRSKFISLLFWSVISAAFIGPGTVTTAAAAGAGYGMQLLWALLFSIIGCIILQEAAARVTIVSGMSLGEALGSTYSKKGYIKWFIFISILSGGAAYQAGNVLGAISGLKLAGNLLNETSGTVLLILSGSLLLWFGKIRWVANIMGIVVAVMGVSFLIVALNQIPDDFISGLVIELPAGAELLVVGLVGTTIVPYNLFLASGISGGQDLSSMRWGIIPAIIIGGLISIGIMMIGTLVAGDFSFPQLAEALEQNAGSWAGTLLAVGLFAAGFTSSITAPLATAVTAKSLFGNKWDEASRPYRLSWILVMLSGLIFGISGAKPIPVIILAQAFNGLLLPGITVFLILVLNHPSVVSKPNSRISNILLMIVLVLTIFIGLHNIFRLFIEQPDPTYFTSVFLISILISGVVLLRLIRLLKSGKGLG